MPVNATEAETQLRPFLDVLARAFNSSTDPMTSNAMDVLVAQDRALRFALQLLGVPYKI